MSATESESVLDKGLNKNAKAIHAHMLSFVNKEVKSIRKTGNQMNVDVALSKLQECIDGNDSAGAIKVLKQSRRVAEQAAERVDIRNVVPILDILLKQLETKPRSSVILFPWIHAIMYHHCAYLSTVAELKSKLDFLHKFLNMRGETYARLLKLQGRLDLFSELSHGDVSNEQEEVAMVEKEEELSELFESAESESE